MVFIFRETVIICDKVTDDQPYSPQLFNYWTSFQVPATYLYLLPTLESGIDVRQGINLGPGKFGRKNKALE